MTILFYHNLDKNQLSAENSNQIATIAQGMAWTKNARKVNVLFDEPVQPGGSVGGEAEVLDLAKGLLLPSGPERKEESLLAVSCRKRRNVNDLAPGLFGEVSGNGELAYS